MIKRLHPGSSTYTPAVKKILPKLFVLLTRSDSINIFPSLKPFIHTVGIQIWGREYFDEITDNKICCGIIADGQLVCCTDAPGMPYMQETTQEIGINTIGPYRQRGYATDVCLLCIQQILNSSKCPMWSTAANNVASQKLAEAIGFVKFGEHITLSL